MSGGESGGLALQGSSHLRYMFPSVDPESQRPVTIKPNGGVTKAERLPQLGLTGEASNSIVSVHCDKASCMNASSEFLSSGTGLPPKYGRNRS